jgi:hypothetical protein
LTVNGYFAIIFLPKQYPTSVEGKRLQMDKKEALKVWFHEYGNNEYAYDITGRKIKREDYQVKNQVGWVVSYMRPLELGGPNDDGNTIILHHFTASEKGMNYPVFYVDDIKYTVIHNEKQNFYYIEKADVEDDDDLNL